MHYDRNTQIQDEHHVQTWPGITHRRLAVPKQPHRKQRPGNCRNEHKCKYHQHLSECASSYIHRRHISSNTRGYTPAEGIHNTGLVTQERTCRAQHEKILAIKKQVGGD